MAIHQYWICTNNCYNKMMSLQNMQPHYDLNDESLDLMLVVPHGKR